ncbi:uncharacterized protein [Penaeus vannamei]|uniref:uncharacterized protein n=1 Tax=Penaeus vannamei TaxID=6689 RepID=UPI00387F6677
MPGLSSLNNRLSILSANVRGLQTNLGDLTHSFVLPLRPDIIAPVETFLNHTVPDNFGRIGGYTKWYRKDRTQGTFGGIADHLDCSLHQHHSENITLVSDLNQYLVARSFDDLLDTFGLTNHVDFPTHISGSSLDPIITDLPDGAVTCQSVGTVGSSDHFAILTRLNIRPMREEAFTRTVWQWGRSNWQGLRDALDKTKWNTILDRDVDDQTLALTRHLVTLQSAFEPHEDYKASCRQQRQGLGLLHTYPHKAKQVTPCRRLLKNEEGTEVGHCTLEGGPTDKLIGQSVGGKSWWSCIKQHKGYAPDAGITPLDKPDGSVAASSQEKAELASYFSGKMTVPEPAVPPLNCCHRLGHRHIMCQSRCKNWPHHLLHCSDHVWHRRYGQKSGRLQMSLQSTKKLSKTSPTNYRPISLLSIVAKVYERILVKRMASFLDEHHLISNRQFGFRSQ